MTPTKKLVRFLLLEKQTPSAAMRQIEKMITSGQAEFELEPPQQTAEELHSVWSIRLWGSVMKGRHILGLRDFVRRLSDLPASSKLRQIAVTQGPKTGLLFIAAQSQVLIGVVFSAPGAADLRRSEENFAYAHGVAIPKFLMHSASR